MKRYIAVALAVAFVITACAKPRFAAPKASSPGQIQKNNTNKPKPSPVPSPAAPSSSSSASTNGGATPATTPTPAQAPASITISCTVSAAKGNDTIDLTKDKALQIQLGANLDAAKQELKNDSMTGIINLVFASAGDDDEELPSGVQITAHYHGAPADAGSQGAELGSATQTFNLADKQFSLKLDKLESGSDLSSVTVSCQVVDKAAAAPAESIN